MTDPSPVTSGPDPSSPVLRILNGRLAGTERALTPGSTISIGYQFWQDVVIRDAATKGIAIDLALDADGGAQITILSGSATMLGSTIEAGGTAIVPAYVPFSLGGVAIAWGDPENARWGEAGGLAQAVPHPPPVPPTISDQAMTAIGRAGEGFGALLSPRRAIVLGGVAALLIAATSAAPALEALGLRGSPAQRVRHAMEVAGLPQLNAVDHGPAGVSVTGVVANEGQRVKAQDVLRASAVSGVINVQTMGELANASVDVARIRGLQAIARPIGPAAIELRTTPLDPEGRAKLTQAVRTDVPALKRLVLRDDMPPPEDVAVKTVADATKKVSTVVAGDPAYIQTVDGARYFNGAIMPSGHRLVSITGDTVMLEKNGRQTSLRF